MANFNFRDYMTIGAFTSFGYAMGWFPGMVVKFLSSHPTILTNMLHMYVIFTSKLNICTTVLITLFLLYHE